MDPQQIKQRIKLARMYMGGLVISGSAILIVYTYQNKTSYIND